MSALTPSLRAWAASEKLWPQPDAISVQASAQQAKMAGTVRIFLVDEKSMCAPSLRSVSND